MLAEMKAKAAAADPESAVTTATTAAADFLTWRKFP